MSYSLADYCDMIKDSARIRPYAEALERCVTPESIVLDMGCGAGIFCLLACTYGAKRVYGIEPNPAVHMAQKVAAANGFGDRIVTFDKPGKDVTLPEKATLMVSDLRGALPFYGQHFDIVRDARERLLTDDARLIPARDDLYAALASSSKAYADLVMPWGDNDFGLDFSLMSQSLANNWDQVKFEDTDTFSTPKLWASLDYAQDVPPQISNTLSWHCDSPITYHGICLWFDCTLCEGVGYTCNPKAATAPRVYGHGFFPFQTPIQVRPGDTVTVVLSADQVHDSHHFSWNTTHKSADSETVFRQSTMAYQAFSSKSLRRRSDDHVAGLSEEGRIAFTVLSAFDEGLSLGEVARRVSAAFPTRFPTWQKAMGAVGDFSIGYGSRDE